MRAVMVVIAGACLLGVGCSTDSAEEDPTQPSPGELGGACASSGCADRLTCADGRCIGDTSAPVRANWQPDPLPNTVQVAVFVEPTFVARFDGVPMQEAFMRRSFPEPVEYPLLFELDGLAAGVRLRASAYVEGAENANGASPYAEKDFELDEQGQVLIFDEVRPAVPLEFAAIAVIFE